MKKQIIPVALCLLLLLVVAFSINISNKDLPEQKENIIDTVLTETGTGQSENKEKDGLSDGVVDEKQTERSLSDATISDNGTIQSIDKESKKNNNTEERISNNIKKKSDFEVDNPEEKTLDFTDNQLEFDIIDGVLEREEPEPSTGTSLPSGNKTEMSGYEVLTGREPLTEKVDVFPLENDMNTGSSGTMHDSGNDVNYPQVTVTPTPKLTENEVFHEEVIQEADTPLSENADYGFELPIDVF